MSDNPASVEVPPGPVAQQRRKLAELAAAAATSYAVLRQACAARNLSATTLLVKGRDRPELPPSIPEAAAAVKDMCALLDVHKDLVEQHGLTCHDVRSQWVEVLDPLQVAVMRCQRPA